MTSLGFALGALTAFCCVVFSTAWPNNPGVPSGADIRRERDQFFKDRVPSGADMRRERDQFFKDPCHQPMYPGPGRGYFPRFYYNMREGKCEEFIFGGLRGNDNNFMTLDACNIACVKQNSDDAGRKRDTYFKYRVPSGADMRRERDQFFKNRGWLSHSAFGSGREDYRRPTLTDYGIKDYGPARDHDRRPSSTDDGPEREQVVEDPCKLPMAPGPGRALKPRFYFNQRTEACEQFTYGGMGGNANNFDTQEACEDKCAEPGDPCYQPKETGFGRAAFPRFYYNIATADCEKFIFGGMRGNANNFKTLDECQMTCAYHSNPCKGPKADGFAIRGGRYIRFYYDESQNKCLQFLFGGGRTTGNNFHTKRACQNLCVH